MPIKMNVEIKLLPPKETAKDTKAIEEYLKRQAGRTIAAAAKTWIQGVADGGVVKGGEWICEVSINSIVTELERPIGEK